jgi:HEAT repeat protein
VFFQNNIEQLSSVLLDSLSPDDAIDAAIQLGNRRDPRGVAGLAQVLNQVNSTRGGQYRAEFGMKKKYAGKYICVEAAKALAQIGGPDAQKALVKALRDSRAGVTHEAAVALRRWGIEADPNTRWSRITVEPDGTVRDGHRVSEGALLIEFSLRPDASGYPNLVDCEVNQVRSGASAALSTAQKEGVAKYFAQHYHSSLLSSAKPEIRKILC